LFAQVLDCPGGLRIQTIHSFCQTLLATFPTEADISPGFRPIEGREEQALVERTLATLAEQSEVGDRAFLADLEILASRMSEDNVRRYLKLCASSEGLSAFPEPGLVEHWLRREVGLPDGDVEAAILAQCHDEEMDCALLQRLADGHRNWKTSKTAPEHAATIDCWLAASPEDRCRTLPDLARIVLKADGLPRSITSGLIKALPSAEEDCLALADRLAELLKWRKIDALVTLQAAGLRAGTRFAETYAAAKRAGGLADFDDLIRWTRDLLAQPGIGEWVRFKLDRRTDHLLVDEAQDTNAAQWRIVRSLVEEFFAGQGSGSDHRTLFIVGDFKQAIYGFQGTDPREFEKARLEFQQLGESGPYPFRDLSITASFRSAQIVLDCVDKVIANLGHEQLGLAIPPRPHRAFHKGRPGLVELWPPFARKTEEEEAAGEEEWEDEDKRAYADHLAAEIGRLVEEAPLLASTGRPLTAGDILVLVRSRASGLAALLVARLSERGVPTAGLDRMQLAQPLAVRDLLSAVTFAVQPLDDLNLAGLLVSPLFGWSQDDLYDLAQRDSRSRLWVELGHRQNESDLYRRTRAAMTDLLQLADYEGPHAFLERILSGPLDGRRRLLGRLGRDKRDPVGELLNAALSFEAQESGGLMRFLHWFASGDTEVKRDPEARFNAVRVMTVHGAKGLEAPVVFLADATADPDKLGPSSPPLLVAGEGGRFPVLRPRKDELCPPFDALVEEEKKRSLEEHHRLGYVAFTRAAERLIVGGLKPSRGEVPETSWHHQLGLALQDLGAEQLEDGRLRLVGKGELRQAPERRRTLLPQPVLPAWATARAPREARPPRPLAPSQLGPDLEASPPPTPALRAAAARGRLLHALFERLPATRPDERRAAALRWLEKGAGVEDSAERIALIDAALSVIEAPAHAALFTPEALAEAPIAATLEDGTVVAGTVDRLLVTDDVVRVVDFKTGRTIPSSAADVPPSHRRQMNAYGRALQVIFPGRRIELALLYTQAPLLVLVPLEDVAFPTHMATKSNQEPSFS
jgi:ATP-dependent helicase/nuclease subunit A